MESAKTNKQRRELIGRVVSAAMQKTIVVQVDRMKLHPKYKKRYRVSKRYHVHDEQGEGVLDSQVRFTECRPLSKNKRWRLVEVLKK